MATKGLKAIAPVPTSADFLDIVLSKTQRKTPTVRIFGCYFEGIDWSKGHPQKLQN
jgi:hypothetical protein